ncbi:unnamed protein product [Orchesella dallaii]|uniref:Uncharacterized protein n=1 Tax=Orchesella dallaii TaxID=48710 RepID=A0ABP1QKU5_9HEXA
MPGYSDLNDLWMPSSKNVFYFGRVYEDTEHAFLPEKKTFQNVDPEKLSIEYLAEDPGSSQEIIGTNVLVCKRLNRPHFKYISSEGKSFPGRLELLEIAAPKLKKAVETMLKERKTQNDPDSKKPLLFHLTTDSEATDKLWRWISYNDKTVVENSQFNIITQLLEFSLENEVLDLLYTVCKEIKNKHVTTNSLLRSYQVFLKYKKAVDIEIVCLMRGWMGQQLLSRFAIALEEDKDNKLAAYDVAKKLFGAEIDENTVGELFGDVCRVYKF